MAGMISPADIAVPEDLPVSVKGVLISDSRFLLVQQPDGMWELPGGKPEPGEHLAHALEREIREETGLLVRQPALIHRWIRCKDDGSHRQVLVYRCAATFSASDLKLSEEHIEFGLFTCQQADALTMLDGYKLSLKRAAGRLVSV